MVKKKTKKRASTPRPYNSGTMSEAEFRSFIVSALRKASMWWKPKSECIREAKIDRNKYKCNICGTIWPSSLPPLPWKKRKRKNIQADHIEEIIPPAVGFTTYDSWIERCFIEKEWFQAICRECHKIKTQAARTLALQYKKKIQWEQ